MAPERPYQGRRAALATRHGKEEVIAPVLDRHAGLAVVVANVDTDALGTFSGEVPRPAGPLDTAVAKARLGMDASGLPLGLASEGTMADPTGLGLGAHTTELVVLVDDDRAITVTGRATSWDTRAVAATVSPADPLEKLLARAGVPPHHLVVSPEGPDPGDARWQAGTTKAVANAGDLAAAVALAAGHSPQGTARVITDLRAHLCPSRQPVIAAAARDLAARLATPCPVCASPGWGSSGAVHGLACRWCGGPTNEVAGHRFDCPACGAHEVTPVNTPGDPAWCPRCNP